MATVSGALPPLDISFEEDPRVLKQAGTEDYSLHPMPRTWRSGKWSLAMAWWSLCSGMFYLVVAGTVTLAVGTVDALIGIVMSVIAYGIINWIIATYAAKSGLTVALYSRSLFGYLGSVVAPLIFGATAIYYMVFEGSIIATAFQFYIGGPLKLWYLIVVLYSMPLVIGGVRIWLDKLNGILLPFYLLGLFGATIWCAVKYGGGSHWLTYKPASTGGIMGPGWWFAFTAYMGVWILMMYTFDYGRFGKSEDHSFHGAFTFGPVFYTMTFLINGLIGIYLAHTVPLGKSGLSEVSIVFSLVNLMGVLGVIFVWVSQTRINTANLYLASTNMEAFFSRSFKIRVNRLWWVLFCGIVAYLIMLTNIFSYILHALAWQGVFVVSWVAIFLATLLYGRVYKIRDPEKFREFRPGRVPYFSPGLLALILSCGAGLALYELGGRFGATWSSPITFAIAFGVHFGTIRMSTITAWYMPRPNDPREEVTDVWEARIRCHACDRSYIAYEMDRDPSHDQKPICAGCASESMSFYGAARDEARSKAWDAVEAVQQ